MLFCIYLRDFKEFPQSADQWAQQHHVAGVATVFDNLTIYRTAKTSVVEPTDQLLYINIE